MRRIGESRHRTVGVCNAYTRGRAFQRIGDAGQASRRRRKAAGDVFQRLGNLREQLRLAIEVDVDIVADLLQALTGVFTRLLEHSVCAADRFAGEEAVGPLPLVLELLVGLLSIALDLALQIHLPCF
ncbi:MAG TPA: hypothetical protein VNG89_28070 [Vicinamibacterales bacterium]|nr:hypothetical protein [Vicinamibacterales bacterium]